MAIEVYISQEEISDKVNALAQKINHDFQGQEVHIICVLNGAFMFCADLVRKINVPVTLDFLKASSYGDSTVSSGEVEIFYDIQGDVKNKNVIVVEDIVDTGLTLSKVLENLKTRDPKSLKLASLLFKPARLRHPVEIDYLAFEIEDRFVIGYGLDFAGKYRELPYIGVYHEDWKRG